MPVKRIITTLLFGVLGCLVLAGCGPEEDDPKPNSPTVNLLVTDATAEETGDTAIVRVTVSPATTTAITVRYQVTGTATNGVDCENVSGSVTIPRDASYADITIIPLDDTTIEGTEEITVQVLADSAYELGVATQAHVLIIDNETPYGTLHLESTDPTATETGNTATLTIRSTDVMPLDLQIPYTVTGTGTNAVDYQYLSGTITMPQGANSVPLVITPINDSLEEGNETITIELRPGAGYVMGSPTMAHVLLVDDENPHGVPEITIEASDPTAIEPNDTGTFTINLSTQANNDLLIIYSVSGTATNGADYQLLSGTVTATAGAWNTTIPVMPLDDAAIEAAETVTVTLETGSGYTLGPPSQLSATVNIEDDDDNSVPLATLTVLDGTASENGANTGTFSVNLSEPAPSNLTINYALTGAATNGADYETLTGTALILQGSTTADIVVTPIDDSFLEWGGETVIATLSPGTGYAVGVPNSGTLLIADDELPIVTVIASDASAAESGNPGRFTLVLPEPAPADFSVTYTMSGAATNGADYTAVTGIASFTAGDEEVNVSIAPIQDNETEWGGETVILTIEPAAGYGVGSPSSATLTIADDDYPVVTVAATDDTGAEGGGNIVFTVSLDVDAPDDITVNYYMDGYADNGLDYETLAGSVVIAKGTRSSTVTVIPIDDGELEWGGESVEFYLSSGPNYTTGTPDFAVGVINDNDLPAATIAVTNSSADEITQDTGRFTITLSERIPVAVTVNYTITGTATNGTDYQTITTSATIAANSSTANITITPIDDNAAEWGGETVILTIASGTNYVGGTPGSATLTIADEDLPTIAVIASDNAGEPADTGTFTIALSDVIGANATINYTVSGTATSGTDYQALSGSVTVPAGSPSADITITPFNDTVLEWLGETVTVTLTPGSGTNCKVGTPDSATLTITDDELPAVSVSIDNPWPLEDGNWIFTFTIAQAITVDTVVNVSLGGSATNGVDYIYNNGLAPTTTITIPANATSVSIPIQGVYDNDESEYFEYMNYTVLPGVGYTVGAPSTAEARLSDNTGG